MMHWRARLLRRLDADLQFFERSLRFDDDGVGAAFDQRRRLLFECACTCASVKSPNGSSNPPKGPMSPSTYPPLRPSKALARNGDAGLVDLSHVVRVGHGG